LALSLAGNIVLTPQVTPNTSHTRFNHAALLHSRTVISSRDPNAEVGFE